MTAALDFLAVLERAEASLLAWGLVDGFFSESEMEALADDFVAGRAPDPSLGSSWDLVERLLDDGLLWQLPNSDRYRTRMGEAVRLFAKLRQIFRDQQGTAWRAAPNLVADYRFVVRPRLYPVRDRDPAQVLAALREQVDVSSLSDAVVRRLVQAGTAGERRLAGFQVRAAGRVLRAVGSERSLGTIVCAGTGSGKTLAFYLPAYAALAERLTSEHWTKCLAIYPRNELLKDQLREALANARRVAPALSQAGRRRFVIAALYGDVPRVAADVPRYFQESWTQTRAQGAAAHVCPYVRCPSCGAAMAWLDGDRNASVERLVCVAGECGDAVGPDEVRLTRERLLREPADILFTSTEMLNQRISSGRYAPLFGIGVRSDRRPMFVLLDEVHSYEGVHGAHVALLMRRWRRAADARVHFVGLSATLADAPRFFADLVGIGAGDVAEVSPQPSELEAAGAEYLLALRSDPSSGTSLLSATIQSAMLLRRILSPTTGSNQGSRVFAFTDNLDVTNRLYHSLLDAEGWDARGNPLVSQPTGSLANIRATTMPNASERFAVGQNWKLVEDLGHVLAPGARIRVGRTSSQDAGVDANAGIVVATSALEVGFDDPEVGAVIQHKAPQSNAAFLQRKGRAGRRRETRPWTVVSLSDFGRDRVAYQAYDQLFSPLVPPRHLPLGNRAVLRMQASFALVDWLTRHLTPGARRAADPWRELSQPATNSGGAAPDVAARQSAYADALRALLEQRAVREDFALFLERSLQVDDQTVEALLWDAPRGVLMEVVPTLLRQLEKQWRMAGGGLEYFVPRVPLPQFVPRALFGDLQLPEVTLRLPAFRRTAAREEAMPLGQALREFAPGRVSRRFGVTHGEERHWVAPAATDDIDVDQICSRNAQDELGTFAYRDDGVVHTIRVIRPFELRVGTPPAEVQSTSNSFLRWHTQVVTTGEGQVADLPDASAWGTVLTRLEFHTHVFGEPVELRRFATGASASMGIGRGQRVERDLRFVQPLENGVLEPVALGSVADVDAVRVSLRYPELGALVQADPRLLQGVRPARFRELIRVAPELDGIANEFQRDWITQAYLSSVASQAMESGTSLQIAESSVFAQGASTVALLQTLMRWVERTASDDEEAPRRVEELTGILRHPSTQAVLHDRARCLWEQVDAGWEPWLRARFKATLGAALLHAAGNLCPRMDPDALLLDLSPRPDAHIEDPRADEFWLTETTIGGAGFVEEFLARYSEDPRRFFRLVEAELSGSDLETVGEDLNRVLERVSAPGSQDPIAAAFASVRQAASHAESSAALDALRTALAVAGIEPSPTLLVALNTRVLQPGTSNATDGLLAELAAAWTAAELQLGIDVEARVFAAARSASDALEAALGVAPVGATEEGRAAWRYGVLYGMLWPRGAQVRAESMRVTSPYDRIPEPDRLLLAAAVSRPALAVSLSSHNWFEELAAILVQHGTGEVVAGVDDRGALAAALVRLACEPIDSSALLVFARVVGVARDGDFLRAALELPEAFQ
jgi:hypothetical protein